MLVYLRKKEQIIFHVLICFININVKMKFIAINKIYQHSFAFRPSRALFTFRSWKNT